MHKPNAIGWFDLYVDDMDRATVFYETVLQRRLAPIGDPTGETAMNSFPADMGAYGAGGALVRSPHSRPGPGGTLIYFSVEDAPWRQAASQRPAGGWCGLSFPSASSVGLHCAQIPKETCSD